jgi:SAM-dependent methyltransferase
MARCHRPRVTGERVSTPANGFNPTWQRHVAAYALSAPHLPAGKVLDVGCGVGHSYQLLAPRETVGLDIDPDALAGQARETRVGDMRELPFEDASFSAVLSVQAIEHVPDPDRALAEARRVLKPGGVAVFVTPNRLTFGPADEVIDPYHYVEFSADELRACCESVFDRVELHGLFGSPRYLDFVAAERQSLEGVLRWDPLRIRRLAPRRLRMALYNRGLRRRRSMADPNAAAIDPTDFDTRDAPPAEALDLVAVCHTDATP